MDDFEYNNEVIEHCPIELVEQAVVDVGIIEDMEGCWYE